MSPGSRRRRAAAASGRGEQVGRCAIRHDGPRNLPGIGQLACLGRGIVAVDALPALEGWSARDGSTRWRSTGFPGAVRQSAARIVSETTRPTASARRSHSGEPGVASGLHRLHARKPARCAAAAVGKKHTLVGRAAGDGQLGRQ